MDLFASDRDDDAPLAWRMRPRRLDDYVGQQALVGPGKPLRRMVESGLVRSMILWGPPGTGKTTLAEILAAESGAHLEHLSAVMAGVKEIRASVERARARQSQGMATLLFLDEIHRLNKSQQDALLPHVESGLLTLIGATTENPSFEVNSALLSRARVHVLTSLSEEELVEVLQRALADEARGLGTRHIHVEEGVLGVLARAAAGDARRALGLLESACDFTQANPGWRDAAPGSPGGGNRPPGQRLRQAGRSLLRSARRSTSRCAHRARTPPCSIWPALSRAAATRWT